MKSPVRSLICTALIAAVSAIATATGTGCAVPLPNGDDFDVSPFLDWRTIRTGHFDIMVPEDIEEIGRRLAVHLEDAHALLSPVLRWKPRHRIQVLVVDNDDSANGLASSSLRFGMILKVTAPDSWSSINYYDDWLRLLALHEYTHILNTDVTTDWTEVLRWVYGDVIRPNHTWSPWMLEGLAVYMETRYTRAGRGRSPFYDMILRAAVERDALDTDAFITLDRLDGNFPYFPGGNTRYVFGYYMMNQIASDQEIISRGMTADRRDSLSSGEDALGIMSYRSGKRVPYFINGNLENITSRSWYDYWESFVSEAKEHAGAQLERIREQPVTGYTKITEGGASAYGAAFSPEGKRIAYTRGQPDELRAVFVRELATGRTSKLGLHAGGVGLAFTPDGSKLVLSDMRRSTNYDVYSDLAYYDVESGAKRWLSRDLRAKDPDVSRDGKWITFSIGRPATQGIAIAPLDTDEDGRLRMGEVKVLYMPPRYDRCSTPKFSADGREVAFSIHRNGRASEEILRVSVDGDAPETLVEDGSFNRFPTFTPDGSLVFVSDRTGVDNLYRLEEGAPGRMLTNVTTGVWLPSFAPDHRAYASVFSIDGWDLAELDLREEETASPQPELVKVGAPMAPPISPAAPDISDPEKAAEITEAEQALDSRSYSPWSSLLPRYWMPMLQFESGRKLVGASLGGFDSAMRHTYAVAAGFDAQVNRPDLGFRYSNRSLGPTFTLNAENHTSATGISEDFDIVYVRRLRGQLSASYTFQWMWSSLTAGLDAGWERSYLFDPSLSPDPMAKSRLVPDTTMYLVYRDALSSARSLTSEEGRVVRTAVRSYFNSGQTSGKALLDYTQFVRPFSKWVLIPRVAGAWSTVGKNASFQSAAVRLGGFSSSVFQGETHDLDRLFLRGYPLQSFTTRGAAVASLELRIPLVWIFRGLGTLPAFLNHVHGVAFAESAYLPLETRGAAGARALPSAGGGIRASTTLFYLVPLSAGVEYHHGFRQEAGGRGQIVGYLSGGLLLF